LEENKREQNLQLDQSKTTSKQSRMIAQTAVKCDCTDRCLGCYHASYIAITTRGADQWLKLQPVKLIKKKQKKTIHPSTKGSFELHIEDIIGRFGTNSHRAVLLCVPNLLFT